MWKPPADQVETDTGWRPPADAVDTVQTNAGPLNAGLERIAQPLRDLGNAVGPYAQLDSMSPIQPQGSNPAMMALSAAGQTFGIQPNTAKSAYGSAVQAVGNQVMAPARLSNTLGQASQPAADYTAEKLGGMGVNPYISAATGMATGMAADPRSWVPTEGVSIEHPNELSLKVAQAREARTGVKARDFQRLYKDPGAIFAGNEVQQAGADIGSAKVVAGIDPGVTNDLSSLTPENIDRINPTKAMKLDDINTVLAKLKNEGQGELPVIQAGSKMGDPHALFAYNDQFGPGGTARSIYNVFGDPQHPALQTRGWGSSISTEDAQQAGIPITGRLPNSMQYEPIGSAKLTPQEAQNALDSVNSILSQPSVQNNRDVFRQWSAVKTHINEALGKVAPGVRAANQTYAREKLGQTFAPLSAVNKSGTPSKLAMLAQQVPGAVGGTVGGALFGPGGAAAGYELGKMANSVYHAPLMAGLQTAAGSAVDSAVNPLLSALEKMGTSPQVQALVARYLQGQNGRQQ
jgi:hypothetical protein